MGTTRTWRRWRTKMVLDAASVSSCDVLSFSWLFVGYLNYCSFWILLFGIFKPIVFCSLTVACLLRSVTCPQSSLELNDHISVYPSLFYILHSLIWHPQIVYNSIYPTSHSSHEFNPTYTLAFYCTSIVPKCMFVLSLAVFGALYS